MLQNIMFKKSHNTQVYWNATIIIEAWTDALQASLEKFKDFDAWGINR